MIEYISKGKAKLIVSVGSGDKRRRKAKTVTYTKEQAGFRHFYRLLFRCNEKGGWVDRLNWIGAHEYIRGYVVLHKWIIPHFPANSNKSLKSQGIVIPFVKKSRLNRKIRGRFSLKFQRFQRSFF